MTGLDFAGARDITGTESERLPTLPVPTAAILLAFFVERPPGLAGYASCLRLAANGAYARDDDTVHDGDEVAVIPPVAGG